MFAISLNEQRQENKNKSKDRNKQRGDSSYNEYARAKWFCCVFKLGFLQLICKASAVFKSNLELALSVILKERKK